MARLLAIRMACMAVTLQDRRQHERPQHSHYTNRNRCNEWSDAAAPRATKKDMHTPDGNTNCSGSPLVVSVYVGVFRPTAGWTGSEAGEEGATQPGTAAWTQVNSKQGGQCEM